MCSTLSWHLAPASSEPGSTSLNVQRRQVHQVQWIITKDPNRKEKNFLPTKNQASSRRRTKLYCSLGNNNDCTDMMNSGILTRRPMEQWLLCVPRSAYISRVVKQNACQEWSRSSHLQMLAWFAGTRGNGARTSDWSLNWQGNTNSVKAGVTHHDLWCCSNSRSSGPVFRLIVYEGPLSRKKCMFWKLWVLE